MFKHPGAGKRTDKLDDPNVLPLKQFCSRRGIKPGTIRTRIHRDQWIEGIHFHKDPLGHIHINVEAYERWVTGVPSPGGRR